MRLLKIEKNDCTPCKMVGQLLDSKNVNYEAGNIDDEPSLIDTYGIMGVPVVILLDDNNNEVQRSTGFNPAELEKMISQL